MRITALLAALGVMVALGGQSHADEIDWAKVDAALGKTASVQGDVHRYGIPRSDLQVTVDGVTIKPALALGGWLGFEPMAGGALVMGDLVLTETEIEPVMTKLLASGIDVTALHNHLLRANPATYYMHVHGHGDPVAMATAIRAALGREQDAIWPTCGARTSSFADRPRHGRFGQRHRREGKGQWRGLPVLGPTQERDHGGWQAGSTRHGNRYGDQLSADRRWQGGDHRRLRDHGRRGEPSNPGFTRKRHRGDGHPQPYAERATTPLLRSLLGQ